MLNMAIDTHAKGRPAAALPNTLGRRSFRCCTACKSQLFAQVGSSKELYFARLALQEDTISAG